MTRRIRILLAVALIITSVVQPLQVFAMTRPLYYSRQNILMFDDECAANPGIGAVQLAGSDNVEKILNFFMQKGLNLAQASGIVGNMMQESGLNPAIIQGGGNATADYSPQNGVGFGLVQWTFTARQAPLVKHIREDLGLSDITSLEGQLSFAWTELTGPYESTLSKLKAADDPIAAAVVVHDGYEVSADSADTVRNVRGGNAQKVYDKFKDAPSLGGETAKGEFKSPGGSPDGPSQQKKDNPAQKVDNVKKKDACTQLPANEANLENILRAYAWPDKRTNNIATPTDDYTQASAKNSKNGIYVGGNNGIDCGGFVTQLMIDSGFEPNYNYSGKISNNAGNTPIQERWLKENWEPLGSSPETLQTGDVAINENHTFVYIRSKTQADNGQYSWFHAETASASYQNPSRAPAADPDQDTALKNSGYQWYRKKGLPKSATDEQQLIKAKNERRV
jgi:hypothetical protein